MTTSDVDIVANRCVAVFKGVYNLLNDPNSPYTNDITSADIKDELGRFKIWGGNVGAFQPKAMGSSLERRLQDASTTRQQVLLLLGDLQESLNESKYHSFSFFSL